MSENMYEFINACSKGQLGKAKTLYCQSDIDIHVDYERVFKNVCYRGHLETAKWLYSLGRTECLNEIPINIHADDDYAFRFACLAGHLDIAIWLYSIGADIHACNDLAFKGACSGGHLEIVKLLYNISPNIINSIINEPDIPDNICEWFDAINPRSTVTLLKQNKFQEVHSTLDIKRSNDNDIRCIICGGENDEVKFPITPCNFSHCYCLQCAYSWYNKHKKECMLCKKEFTWKTISAAAAAKNPVS